MFTLTVAAAIALTAPPAKVVDSERITIAIGDEIVHFKPDGSDPTTIALRKDLPASSIVVALTPDRRTVVLLSGYENRASAKVFRSRLTLAPLGVADKPFTLDGYVAYKALVSANGATVYFAGAKGDQIERVEEPNMPVFALDVATKKVTAVALPERHVPFAVAADDKSFVTMKPETVNNRRVPKFYFTPIGGKTVEVFAGLTPFQSFALSPDGTKVLALIRVHNASGGWVAATCDVTTGEVKKRSVKIDFPLALAWSPDGKRIAHLSLNPLTRETAGKIEYYVLKVVDTTGDNAKEVYQRKTEPTGWSGALLWK
jgi:hypothetical protein